MKRNKDAVLSQEELDFLMDKLQSSQRLTLEEVMMLSYQKPCRRVFPKSDDIVINDIEAERGSVIVGKNEVVVVCNPLDFHLLPPKRIIQFNIRIVGSTQDNFYHGSTIIHRVGYHDCRVIYYLDNDSDLMKILCNNPDQPWDRWGGEMIGGLSKPFIEEMRFFTKESYPSILGGHTRIMTCAEEYGLMGTRAAMNIKRLAPLDVSG